MFATEVIKEKGKVIKRYAHKDVKTPLVALEQLLHKGLAKLKPGQTLAALQQQAKAKTDSAAAQEMQLATAALFASFCQQ